jgi:hypothetical protein
MEASSVPGSHTSAGLGHTRLAKRLIPEALWQAAVARRTRIRQTTLRPMARRATLQGHRDLCRPAGLGGRPPTVVSPRGVARSWTFRLTGRVTPRRIA